MTGSMPTKLSFAAVLAAAVLTGCGGTDRPAPATSAAAAPAAAPAATSAVATASTAARLAANRAQAGKVIDGDVEETLASLKGLPVVVMQWASWCPQCAREFPWFQKLADTYRSKVAFVGLNARDARGDAEAFSADNALKFASIYDEDGSQSAAIGAGRSWPTTVLYDAQGRRTVRPGAFSSLTELDDYIQRYALKG